MQHLADVLRDPKSSVARKDKAARLILTHSGGAPAKTRRVARAAAADPADKGKKELQREQAESAGDATKWKGLLQ